MTNEHHLKLARILVKLLEKNFKIGKFEFGLDPLIGLIPTVGDFFPALVSFYLVYVAYLHEASLGRILKMIFNILFDFLIGLIPILGDILDFAIDSNTKNIQILEAQVYESKGIIEGEIIE